MPMKNNNWLINSMKMLCDLAGRVKLTTSSIVLGLCNSIYGLITDEMIFI